MESSIAEIGVQKYDLLNTAEASWLGQIPEHWHVMKSKLLWKEVVDLSNDGSECLLSVSQYSGVTPTVEDSRSESFIGYKKVREGNLVINIMLAWMGGLGISNYNGIVSPAYAVYKSTSNIDIRYFHFLYRTPTYLAEFARRSRGIVPSRWRMYTDDFGQVLSLLPPLEEQTAIANFLDRKAAQITQAIAQKELLIKRLHERRQILIQRAVTRGLNPDVPMKDSGVEGIGEIPSHWKVLFNRRIFRENSRQIVGVELPLSLSQVDGVIPSEEMKERSLSPAHRDNFKLCLPGDLIVNRFKGHLGVFFQSPYRGIVTFHYGVFEPEAGINSKYYELLYHTEAYKTIYAGASNGMTVGLQNLSNNNFYNIKSIIPPLDEQNEIIARCEKVADKVQKGIDAAFLQIEQLREYKSTLINAAVTGKIKVC